jgi:hypothetical protein
MKVSDEELLIVRDAVHHDLMGFNFSPAEQDGNYYDAYRFFLNDVIESDSFVVKEKVKYQSALMMKYPGIVPITKEAVEKLSMNPVVLKAAGIGLTQEEVKRNVFKFALWFSFDQLKQDPGCVLKQNNAYKWVFSCKEIGVGCDADDLVMLLKTLGPPDIREQEVQRDKARGEIGRLMIMDNCSQEKAAYKWWEDLQNKSNSELNEFERKCKLRDARGAFDMLRTYIHRMNNKRNELAKKIGKL